MSSLNRPRCDLPVDAPIPHTDLVRFSRLSHDVPLRPNPRHDSVLPPDLCHGLHRAGPPWEQVLKQTYSWVGWNQLKMNPTNRGKNKICLKSRTRLELSKLSTKRQRDSVQFHIFCFGLFILFYFKWICVDTDCQGIWLHRWTIDQRR